MLARAVPNRGISWSDDAPLCSILLCAATATSASASGVSRDFEFEDDRYLLEGQSGGGRAYVSDLVDPAGEVPLVIFLHGINPGGPTHLWMGGGERDLRAVVASLVERVAIAPVIVAAPSQTRNASSGRALWEGFDLEAFTRAVQQALGERASIDAGRVILIAHSGGGCNADGGLLGVASQRPSAPPLALLAIDTCMDEESGAALGRASPFTSVGVFWQTESWPRDQLAFRDGFGASRPTSWGPPEIFQQLTDLGADPHNAIVEPALTQALAVLLPPS